MLTVDLQSRTPIYEQLYKKIIELIMKKELNQNDQIPSVRILAKELGINPNTVSKAYTELERDGIIYTLAGRGSFVSKIDVDKVKEKALENFDKSIDEALNVKVSFEELNKRLNLRKDIKL